MIRIDYDFKEVYRPETSISNALTDGETGLSGSLTIQNKKYGESSELIYDFSGNHTVVFNNCLFVDVMEVVRSVDISFSSLTFRNCTFENVQYIVNTNNLPNGWGVITFEYCVLHKSLHVLTSLEVSFSNCIYDGVIGMQNVTYTNCINANPRLLENDNYYLMSKSRGFMFNSPALKELTGCGKDPGCWNEKRGIASTTNKSLLISSIPDKYKNSITLPGFKSFENEEGKVVQTWIWDKEKKTLIFSWSNNWLEENELVEYIKMIKSKRGEVVFYPNHDDNTRYCRGTLIKDSNISYSKLNGIYFEDDPEKWKLAGFQNITITIRVEEEEGGWL